MAAYIVYLLVRNDPARHYWIVVISTAELYGGLGIPYTAMYNDVHPLHTRFMTFGPSWLEGSPSLNTSNWLYLWVYLIVRIRLSHRSQQIHYGFLIQRLQFMNIMCVFYLVYLCSKFVTTCTSQMGHYTFRPAVRFIHRHSRVAQIDSSTSRRSKEAGVKQTITCTISNGVNISPFLCEGIIDVNIFSFEI
jgi:hypothetical protein